MKLADEPARHGAITATHALARLGDWREIKTVRQIAGFLGLVSTEHSTGDKQNRGSITRSADSCLRNKLIQCAGLPSVKIRSCGSSTAASIRDNQRK